MKIYKILFITIIIFELLFAAERQNPKKVENRDECGYGFIMSCYDETTCYPAGWLSDGQCDPQLACYSDDGLDCEGGEGGLFMEDCDMCESMDNNMTCYDLLGQWINCFGCYQVYDCAYDCMGNAAEDCNGDCNGDAIVDECGECGGEGIGAGECDCWGNVLDECGICGGDNNWCSAPEAQSATHTLTEDNMIAVYLSGSDADGEVLTFSLVSNPTNGIVELDGVAATYMPDANFNGTDSFDFIVNDGIFDSNVATINLVVVPVNDAPFWLFLPEDEEIAAGEIAVYTLEAEDVDGDDLLYQLINVSGPGTATLAGNILTIQAADEGEIEITVSVSDGIMIDEETFILLVLPLECADEYEQGFFDGSATGDVNGDGVLNVVDIVFFVQMILNAE